MNEILHHQLIEFDDFHISVWNIILMLLLFFGLKIFFYLFTKILQKRLLNKGKVDDGRLLSTVQLTKYFLYVVAAFILIKSVGLDIDYLVGASAALLVGVGMGLQQTFNDFMSGVIVLFEGTLEVGDVVEVDNIVGTVKEIRLRTCKIETRESIVMIIPNSKFVTSNVINWSHNHETTLFKIKVGVAYGSDVEIVKKTLVEAADEHGEVMKSPKPFVRFIDFGESSLDFELFFWTNHIWQVENLKSDLRFMIDKKFRENQIRIPFPQRDVHIKKDL